MNSANGFSTVNVSDCSEKLIFDELEGALPSAMYHYEGRLHSGDLYGERSATVYGFVTRGSIVLKFGATHWAVSERHWFSVPGSFEITGDGAAVLFMRLGVLGEFHIAGRLPEDRGRLAYLDGCSTSLLLPPLRKGDPVVNSLWFPPARIQTEHLHPTVRLAYVVSGEGVCVTAGGDRRMAAGLAFRLEPMALHYFRTSSDALCVVTYHPDSDWGPTDEIHPVMNQTLLAK